MLLAQVQEYQICFRPASIKHEHFLIVGADYVVGGFGRSIAVQVDSLALGLIYIRCLLLLRPQSSLNMLY